TTRLEPLFLRFVEKHVHDLPFLDGDDTVPSGVTTAQFALSGVPVVHEDPLLAVLVLEVAEVLLAAAVSIRDGRRAATILKMNVVDNQKRLLGGDNPTLSLGFLLLHRDSPSLRFTRGVLRLGLPALRVFS